MALVLAVAILLAVPVAAAARQAGDAELEREVATLPREMWAPAPEPVSAAGPGLPEDAGGVAPLLAVLLLLGALGAGYVVSVLRPGTTPAPPAHQPDYETCAISVLGRAVDRAPVATRPEGEEAEFVALALDESGNAHVMARSPRFHGRADRPVDENGPAAAAHAALLDDLENEGWHVEGTPETWYGATLARRRDSA